jgi:adenosine deaminase
MEHVVIEHPLDWGQHYTLIFSYTPNDRTISGRIRGPVGSSGVVERHLVTLIAFSVDNQKHHFIHQQKGEPVIRLTLPKSRSTLHEIMIRLGGTDEHDGEIFGCYRLSARGVEYSEIFQRLTVFETRMLGNEKLYRWLPYPRGPVEPTFIRTDLHTHWSGQISAQGLIDIALQHRIAYPIRLLDMLDISYPRDQIEMTQRFFFPPTDAADPMAVPKMEEAVAVAALGEDERARLRTALSIPPDQQMTFGDLEITVYRYRTPISKHPDVAYDLLLRTAQEYAQQGISYAEITGTSTSLLVPEYIALLHDRLPEIEALTGVKLRFLAGLPRNLPSSMLHREVEKLKLMAASPYIVGVDFMGFEDNKIGELEPYMQSIAAWAYEYDPEFTLRIHAGENRKNLTNVKESLRLAHKYRMRVRIGHAAHGLDDEAIGIAEELAREKLAVIEFNPDSNIALNNIDTAEELDLAKCITRDIPFVLCSDGGGLFQTDARQLETAASFAGVGQNRLTSIMQSENDHLHCEEMRFLRKQQALPADFLSVIEAKFKSLAPPVLPSVTSSRTSTDAFEQHLTAHHIEFSPESIAATTRDKIPLMILGASGERYWNLINAHHKQQVQEVIDMLVQKLDPAKMYFLIGRPKDAGITSLLSRAVQAHNSAQPESRFHLISATVQADQTTHSFTPGLTHVLPLKGSLFTVPNQLVSFVAEAKGHILFIGGGTFVRDAILIARNQEVSFGMMKGPEGASTDKAVMMDPAHQFTDAASLMAHLYKANPTVFKS